MEDGSMHSVDVQSDELCESILSRYSNSKQEEHQHLCLVIGSMSQGLKDQNLPLTPVAYFGAACSSLDRLSYEKDPSPHVINSLMTILSLVVLKISPAIIKKKEEFLSGLLFRVLRSISVEDSAAVAGLKCVAHMLMIRDHVNWTDVSQMYGVLLGYMTDSRPKVRKQAHICIRDVLQKFRGTQGLAPASEGITNIFEKFLLLAGGSNPNSADGAKGAQEVLHVLDALKECLPLMSMKYSTSVLKHFKTLLELRQPIVTRRITDGLNTMCLSLDAEVPVEQLLELLCSLGLSVLSNETSADGMAFRAHLLSVGMTRIYGLNRQLCVVKLPIVFNALKDILTSEHEEAIFAATKAFKSLIDACIDGSLIKQGVDQITNVTMDERKSGPTIIEKMCSTTESLLDYHYSDVWDMSFEVVSAMFDKLGYYSSYFMRGTLKNLSEMQKMPDEDFPYRKQLHDCVGSALGAMGPETFLSLLPLKLDTSNIAEVEVWLFPILKQYTVGASLSFFTETILGMVEMIKQKARKLELEGRSFSSRSADSIVYSLWSMLPSFCNYPLDTADSFKDLEKHLCNALREQQDIRGIICSSLQILIQQNKEIVEGRDVISNVNASTAMQRAISQYTPQAAADNLKVLGSCGRNLLSVLSGIILESSKDDGGCLKSAIGGFAQIAEKKVVTRLFARTMQRLLDAQQAAQSGSSMDVQGDDLSNDNSPSRERARLLDLALSLFPGLDVKEMDVLFIAIQPALQDNEGFIQKKAYKVLSVLLQNNEFVSSKLEELLGLMIEVLPSCYISAKRHRLDCLYFLIAHVSKTDGSEQMMHAILSSFLTEIVLALKETNKKTRNRAYDVLVQIGHAYGDEESGGKKENLNQLFNMVAGGLAGESPQMISAAVKGLARLAYEFSDLVSNAYQLLPSTFLLLKRKNREIIKANLGLLKVLVAKSQADWLQAHLKSVVEGLLKWQDNTKNHFKAKVKLLLEMLVKKCGMDAVKSVMPEEHMKLLTNIRKIKERKERKLAASTDESKSRLSMATSRASKWNHTKVFSDAGDEEEDSETDYMDSKTVSGRQSKASSLLKSKAALLRSKRTRRADKSLPEDFIDQMDDEPLDLLDRHKTRSALRSSEHQKRKSESDDEELELDIEGRLIISEGGRAKKKKPAEDISGARSEAGSRFSGTTSKKNQKRRKTSESGWAYTGSEYASKKAGGDLSKKDKLEPYAYWPLDRKMMSRRPEHRAAARRGMSSVVKMAKRFEGKSASAALSMKFQKKSGGKRKNK